MGVYQSATEPDVRAKTVKHYTTNADVENFGKDYFTRWLRKKYGIPRKTRPIIIDRGADGWTWKFEWYEVETFN